MDLSIKADHNMSAMLHQCSSAVAVKIKTLGLHRILISTIMSGNGGRRQRKLSRLKISTRFYYFSLFRYTSWYSLLNRSYLSVILYFIFFKTNSLLLQSRVSQSVHARNIKGNTTRFRSRQ